MLAELLYIFIIFCKFPIVTHETNERHAVVMALKTQPDEEFEDLNYKPNCPVVCTEESHKIKTIEIKKSMGK